MMPYCMNRFIIYELLLIVYNFAVTVMTNKEQSLKGDFIRLDMMGKTIIMQQKIDVLIFFLLSIASIMYVNCKY